MWLAFALLSAFCWAIIELFDERCVDERFSRPILGMVVSGALSVPGLLLPLLTGWSPPMWSIFLSAFTAGVLSQVCQGLYFCVLEESDAGTIGSYENLIPVTVLLTSFLFFGELLSRLQYLGITLVLGASTALCLLDRDERAKPKWSSFMIMLGAAFLMSSAIFLQNAALAEASWSAVFPPFVLGIVLTGLSPLLCPTVRAALRADRRRIRSIWHLFLAIEMLNLTAYGLHQLSLARSAPSLVETIMATIPAFIFLLSPLVSTRISAGESLFPKLGYVATMVLGIALLS